MSYRPEGWANPFWDKTAEDPSDDVAHSAFEYGADAMYQPAYDKGKADGKKELLEALRKQGEHYNAGTLVRYGPVIDVEVPGTLVFIPDEEARP